jgi:hypothetical protein
VIFCRILISARKSPAGGSIHCLSFFYAQNLRMTPKNGSEFEGFVLFFVNPASGVAAAALIANDSDMSTP